MKNLAASFCKAIFILFCAVSFPGRSIAQTGTHLHFDGSNDFVTIPNTTLFNFGTLNFTVEAWIKTSFSGTGVVVGASGSGDFWLGVSGSKAAFSISGTPLFGTTSVNNNQWHHIAGVRQAGIIYIYVDGVLDGSLANNLSFATIGQTPKIGNFNGGFHFQGEIDEVRIWNIGQTAADIAAKRNVELAGNEAGLITYYKFNQGAGGGNNAGITSLTDASTNALHGTLSNFALSGVTSNWLSGSAVPGKSIATHLNFDGVNDYISAPVVLPTTNTTVELWFKTTNPNAGLFTVTTSTSDFDRDIYLSGGNVYSYVYAPTVFLNSTGTNYADGNWHHVAQIISSTAGESLYVDGILKASNAGVTSSGFNWNDRIFIGRSLISGQYSNADIDEVRIWNVVRTGAQVAGNCPLTGNETGLMAYYRFDQGIPAGSNAGTTTLLDATINNRNGTLSGFALSGNTSNWQVLSPVVSGPDVTASVSYCQTSSATALTATGTGLLWYTSQFSGTGSSSAPTPSTAATGTTSYWVTQTTGCGESPRSRIDVTVSPQILASGNTNPAITLAMNGTTNFNNSCNNTIAIVTPSGASPISGNTTAKVWIENTQPANYVKRHFEITPATNAATATGTITLYFTQPEFDAFNAVNGIKLPTGPADSTGTGNIRIEKRSGVSSDGSGLPGTYSGTALIINPADANIIWNTTLSRWEISFDVGGFSGFFLHSSNLLLPLSWLNVSGTINNNKMAVINWRVSETNVASYVLEKSVDGRNFTVVAKTNSKGNGTNSYSITEAQTLNGTAWYRIKQADRDERFSYSTVIKLHEKNSSQISVYPNPFTNSIMVTSSHRQLAVLKDVTGKTIKQTQLQKGVNHINAETLRSGLYLLKVDDGNVFKLVKE